MAPEGQSIIRFWEQLCRLTVRGDALADQLDLLDLTLRPVDDTTSRIQALTARTVEVGEARAAAALPGAPGGPPEDIVGSPPGQAPPDVVKHPGNKLSVVLEVDAANPGLLEQACTEQGGNHGFLDLLVARLRTESIRWGYACVRTDCSRTRDDQVTYYAGLDTGTPPSPNTNFYNFDVIANVCASPAPQWTDKSSPGVGSSAQWKYPR